MPSATPVYALPYPLGAEDVRDGNDAIQALAARVEALLAASSWGSRNLFRNGDLGVAQRGNGPFTATGAYTIDGWAKSHTGGTHTVNRAVTAPGQLGTSAAPAMMENIITGQAAAGDYAQIFGRIEGVRALAGQQAAFSFIGQAGSGTPKVAIEVAQSFGTGGSPSATVFTAVQAVTLSNLAVRYVVPFTVPSITSKVLGTGRDDFLQIAVWMSAGATFAARASNIGIQNANFYLTDFQLEGGDKATPFERLSQQAQDAWCKRYFKRFQGAAVGGGGGGYSTLGHGGSMAASSVRLGIHLPGWRPFVPTIVLASGTAVSVNVGAAGSILTPNVASVTNLFWSPNTPENPFIDCAVTPSVNIGYPAFAYVNNGPQHYVDFSSEL